MRLAGAAIARAFAGHNAPTLRNFDSNWRKFESPRRSRLAGAQGGDSSLPD